MQMEFMVDSSFTCARSLLCTDMAGTQYLDDSMEAWLGVGLSLKSFVYDLYRDNSC